MRVFEPRSAPPPPPKKKKAALILDLFYTDCALVDLALAVH